MMMLAELPPVKAEKPLTKQPIHCGRLPAVSLNPAGGCGKVLMEVAGAGDVVIFKICRDCKSMNIIDMRMK